MRIGSRPSVVTSTNPDTTSTLLPDRSRACAANAPRMKAAVGAASAISARSSPPVLKPAPWSSPANPSEQAADGARAARVAWFQARPKKGRDPRGWRVLGRLLLPNVLAAGPRSIWMSRRFGSALTALNRARERPPFALNSPGIRPRKRRTQPSSKVAGLGRGPVAGFIVRGAMAPVRCPGGPGGFPPAR